MNVTCPNCATIYRVDPAKVPQGGVRARCNVCSAVFAVRREGDAAPVAAPMQPAASKPESLVSQAPRIEPNRESPALRAEPPRAEPPRAEPPRPEPARPEPSPLSPRRMEPPRAEPPRPEPPRVAPSGVQRPAAAVPPSAPKPGSPQRPVSPAGATPVARPTTVPPASPSGPPRPAAPAAAAPRPASPSGTPPAVPVSRPPASPSSAPAPAPAGTRPVNPFLSQDPALKARRLARALISDMVVYHPGKRQEGLRDGNLKELFEEEIKKSWEEYAEQVGRDVADSTPYFREALNEILAGGRQVF